MNSSVQLLWQIKSMPSLSKLLARSCGKCLSRFHQSKRQFHGVSNFKSLRLQRIVNSSFGTKKLHKSTTEKATTQTTFSSSSLPPGTLTKQQAKELAVKLTSEERSVLINALQECQSQKTKAEYEGQLAAFRWRSQFGRPSKVSTLGDVDPTGSFCEVPDDWLLRKYEEMSKGQNAMETVPPPCRKQLIRVSLANAIPFVGFGFLDNFIMIIAGDQIETLLGSVVTLSTMAAAALGNTFSDILGIGSAFYVERMAVKIGFEAPKLTPIQMDMPKTRLAANIGRVIGVTVGCILGMAPLLIIHHT